MKTPEYPLQYEKSSILKFNFNLKYMKYWLKLFEANNTPKNESIVNTK